MIALFICSIINSTQISCDGEIKTTDSGLFLLTIILAVVTAGSVIFGIWLTEKFHKRVVISDSKQTLKTQIESITRIINDQTVSINGITFTSGISYTYTPVQFDTISYNTLVFSGTFQKFDLNKQEIIADYFSLVNEHNYIMKEIDRLMPYTTIRTIFNFRGFMDYIESLEVKLDTLEREILRTADRLRTNFRL